MGRTLLILGFLVMGPFLAFVALFAYEWQQRAGGDQSAGGGTAAGEVSEQLRPRFVALERKLDRLQDRLEGLEAHLGRMRLVADAQRAGADDEGLPLPPKAALPALAHTPVDWGEGRRAKPRLTYAITSAAATLDPAIMTGVLEGRIASALFEGLTTYHPETLEPLPGMAKNWQVSEDGLVYTFFLRDDAVWTNGQPVTADDFVWSWNRVIEPRTASQYSYMLYNIKNAEVLNLASAWLPFLTRRAQAAPAGPWRLTLDELRAAQPPLVVLEEADAARPEVERRALEIAAARRTLELFAGRGLLGELTEDGDGFTVRPGVRPLSDAAALGVRALSPTTLEVTLESPTAYFLDITSFSTLLPVNRTCVEGYAERWTDVENIITNGPFALQAVETNARLILVRNPAYWDWERVRTQELVIRIVEDQNTQISLFEKGEIDWPDDLPSALIDVWKTRPEFHKHTYLGTYYFRFNVTRPPFNDPVKGRLIRRALNLAVNRQEICDYITRGGQVPATHYVPHGLPNYPPPPDGALGLRVAEAQRLLAEAGHPGGAGLPEISILYNTSENHKKIAAALQDMWRQHLGVKASLQNMEWKSYLDATKNLDFDVCRAGWIGDYTDPNTFLDMFVTGGGNNNTGWSNAVYDRIITLYARDIGGTLRDPAARARLRADAPRVQPLVERWLAAGLEDRPALAEEVRLSAFQEAEAILLAELPILPVYYYVSINLHRPELHNISGNIRNIIPLKWVWVEQR